MMMMILLILLLLVVMARLSGCAGALFQRWQWTMQQSSVSTQTVPSITLRCACCDCCQPVASNTVLWVVWCTKRGL